MSDPLEPCTSREIRERTNGEPLEAYFPRISTEGLAGDETEPADGQVSPENPKDPWTELGTRRPSYSDGDIAFGDMEYEVKVANDDVDSLEKIGIVEYELQSGLLAAKANDIHILSDGKVRVDLGFLKDGTMIERVKDIITQVIKTFSTVPGSVLVEKQKQKGVFIFSVKNDFYSPTTDSSESESKISESRT